jgi:hypothetical protein
MAKSEPYLSVPETREFYWSKIEREIRRLEPRGETMPENSFTASLRRFLLPAGALAALAVAGLVWHFHGVTPKDNVADADTPTVETTLASTDATTYRDASEGTTLVWFSPTVDDSLTPDKKPTVIN